MRLQNQKPISPRDRGFDPELPPRGSRAVPHHRRGGVPHKRGQTLKRGLQLASLTVLLAAILAAADRAISMLTGTSTSAVPGPLRPLLLLALLAAAFLVLWHLTWVTLAYISRLNALPGVWRDRVAFAVSGYGPRLARRLLAAGTGSIAAGALLLPAAQASEDPQLWPSVQAEDTAVEEPANTEAETAGEHVPLWFELTPPELPAEAEQTPRNPTPALDAPTEKSPEKRAQKTAVPSPKKKAASAAKPSSKPAVRLSTSKQGSNRERNSRIAPPVENTPAAPPPPARRTQDEPAPTLPVPSGEAEPQEISATYTVGPGDTLWDTARKHLPQEDPSEAEIDRAWRMLYEQNIEAIGDNPDLIHPGQVLNVTGLTGKGD